MAAYQSQSLFFLDAPHQGRPCANAGMLFASSRPEMVSEGDSIERLPGGLFLTRRGSDRRIRLVNSRQNLAMIQKHCFRVAG